MRTPQGVRFVPWDWNLALSDNVIVLCGEGCAAALLSRCLGEWKQAEGRVEFGQISVSGSRASCPAVP